MRPLELDDLFDLDEYEAVRDAYRRAVIAHKQDRRLGLGDRVTIVFEDRETVRWQVLEMARVERIRDPALLQHELDVYNGLLPPEGGLSATVFIEITELGSIRSELDRLIGLDEHLALVLGAGPAQRIVAADFDRSQLEEDRISAVHYVRFALEAPDRALLADRSVPARLRIDHPRYRAETPLPAATRASLLRDLAGGPSPLLGAVAPPAPVAARAGAGEARDRCLVEGERVRVRVPAARRAAGHLVIEARRGEGLAEADPALLAELASFVQRFAPELAARHGGCRLEADLAGPLRWHLLAP